MEKTLTLKFTNYEVHGIAHCTYWDDTKFSIPMKPYHIKSLDDILAGVNDNGFGCRSIDCAEIEIFENYEGTLLFLQEMEIIIPQGFGKRGV